MKTKLKIFSHENPLEDTVIELDLPRRVKILSNEPYVEDLYNSYMLDKAQLIEPVVGEIMEAKISKINSSTIELDINSKESIFIETFKQDKRYVENLQLGDSIKVMIEKKGQKGHTYFTASLDQAVNKGKIDEILDSIGKPVAYKAKVDELINGGYWLTIDGIKVFMPGSLAGINKLWDFDTLLNKEIVVMPINYSKEKETIVVSYREYLKTLIPNAIDYIKANKTEEYHGKVTGTSAGGVFVEFKECLTTLISVNDLSDTYKTKYLNGSIKPGDDISFFVKEIINNNNKIISAQKLYNHLQEFAVKYPLNTKITGKITKIMTWGSFIEIERGIVGLLHSSEYKGKFEHKEGDQIEILITKIDQDNKKINLILP